MSRKQPNPPPTGDRPDPPPFPPSSPPGGIEHLDRKENKMDVRIPPEPIIPPRPPVDKILCRSCEHCMIVVLENVQGVNKSHRRVTCLVYPSILNNLLQGNLEGEMPRVTSCNKYKKQYD